MSIVGCDQRQSHAVGDIDSTQELFALDLQPIIHDLDEVPIAKKLGKPSRDVLGLFNRSGRIGASKDHSRKFARHASTQADDPLVVLLKDLLIDTGLVVETFELGTRGKSD